MGCFSFICKISNESVKTDSSDGDAVHLFLLKDGEVIEHQYGKYDSYGSVFDKEGNSIDWNVPYDEIVNLIYHPNEKNGIAAILSPFWKEGDPYPKTISLDDPQQGYCEYNYFIPLNADPFHKILKI